MESSTVLDQVRQIPLESILAYHGLAPRREGTTTRYKGEAANIVLTGSQLWFDNATSVGGRGVIDLVLHLRYGVSPRAAGRHDFENAVRWLSTFQPGAAVTLPSHQDRPEPPKETFEQQAARLAIRDDERWSAARRYLLDVRGLPSDLVDGLYHQGDVYASFSEKRPGKTGACFVHRDLAGRPCGATIRPIDQDPAFPISIGEKRTAWFTLGDLGSAKEVVVTEAPIDAISYVAIRRSPDTAVLAMSGSHVFRPVLQAAHDRRWHLAVAFDNDHAGLAGYESCRENQDLLFPDDPPVQRIAPRGKDWNDDLRQGVSATRGFRP